MGGGWGVVDAQGEGDQQWPPPGATAVVPRAAASPQPGLTRRLARRLTCPAPPAVCAKAADAETAFECYGQMRERGVRPDREVYATLIDACTRRIARTAPSDR